LSIDNSAMISGRKARDMSKVSKCFKEKMRNFHSELSKYFCLICINHYYLWN